MVLCLLTRRAVVPEAVGLDDEIELRPMEINEVAVDPLASSRWRQAGVPDETQEAPLELGIGELEGPSVENLAKQGHAVDARVLVNRFPKRFRVDQGELVCLVHCCFERTVLEDRGEVNQGPGRGGDRDPVSARDVCGGFDTAAMKADTSSPPEDIRWNGDVDWRDNPHRHRAAPRRP